MDTSLSSLSLERKGFFFFFRNLKCQRIKFSGKEMKTDFDNSNLNV